MPIRREVIKRIRTEAKKKIIDLFPVAVLLSLYPLVLLDVPFLQFGCLGLLLLSMETTNLEFYKKFFFINVFVIIAMSSWVTT